VIDGKSISGKIIKGLKFEGTPGLAVILVGDDPASELYTAKKVEACKKVGIASVRHELSQEATEREIISLIINLNHDDSVHGILIQLPLPEKIDQTNVLAAVAPGKDVDGFTPENIGRMISGSPVFMPCTPMAVMKIIESTGIKLEGKNVVVVGHSLIVGKPLSFMLLNAGATVTVCHHMTRDLASHTKNADILVSATGQPHLIKADMVKKDAIVIDVGISKLRGKIVGDVDYQKVSKITDNITPVPGGVGPVTIACLLENTVKAYESSTL